MRIAQLAPLAESVPPKLYGGTERVVAWLVDELAERVAASVAKGTAVAFLEGTR
jgi:hypothetical protein